LNLDSCDACGGVESLRHRADLTRTSDVSTQHLGISNANRPRALVPSPLRRSG
jgi:hypothetical protein